MIPAFLVCRKKGRLIFQQLLPITVEQVENVLQNGFKPGFDKFQQRFFLWIVVDKFVDIVDKSVDN